LVRTSFYSGQDGRAQKRRGHFLANIFTVNPPAAWRAQQVPIATRMTLQETAAV